MQTKKHTQCAGLVYFIIIQHSFITIRGRARGAGKPPTRQVVDKLLYSGREIVFPVGKT
jgi:hypothetical protein